MEDYLLGSDILGAGYEVLGDEFEVLGAEMLEILGASMPANPQGPFVTIHVKNIPELVAKQGGSQGAFVQQLLPSTIENVVYSKMAGEIAKGMKAQGVDADVKVVSDKPARGATSSDFTIGAVAGAGGVGLLYGMVKLFKHFVRK
jgi:hypothetical protein